MQILQTISTIRIDSLGPGMTAYTNAVNWLNENASFDVYAYAGVLGYPRGTVATSIRIEDYGLFVEEHASLQADDRYLAVASSVGSYFVENPNDTLWDISHVAGELASEPSNVIAQISVQALPRQLGEAKLWAIKMADSMNRRGGTITVVATTDWGTPNTIRWFCHYESLDSLEACEDNLVGPDHLFTLNGSEELVNSSTIQPELTRRII